MKYTIKSEKNNKYLRSLFEKSHNDTFSFSDKSQLIFYYNIEQVASDVAKILSNQFDCACIVESF